VARDYPNFRRARSFIDNCCMQMVSNHQQFDVDGDGQPLRRLVSDLGAGVVAASRYHASTSVDGIRVYESFHGGPRDAAGINGQPAAVVLPAVDLLKPKDRWAAGRIMTRWVGLTEKKSLTADLGGNATTTEMTER